LLSRKVLDDKELYEKSLLIESRGGTQTQVRLRSDTFKTLTYFT